MAEHITDAIRSAAVPLHSPYNYNQLLEHIGDARFVLIGEASHGTHEFYRERARITQRLIQEKNFSAVAVEADWPDAYRVNCFVRGVGDDQTADEALGDFQRFPIWMWRNSVVHDFVTWLREYNARQAADTPKVGFYGLDLYSLYTSIKEVIGALERIDPEAAKRARGRYSCFEDFGRDPQMYGYAASAGRETCEDDVVNQLLEVQRRAAEIAHQDGQSAEDTAFYIEQNARLVKNAEQYYRSMFRGRHESWNLRDRHMAETLDQLSQHLSRDDQPAKVVVWAHNSHLGDARATAMGRQGELNVGQLAREHYGEQAYLIGFTTYTGTVTAASDWDEPSELKQVRPALEGSYEAVLHQVGIPNFMLNLRDNNPAVEALGEERLERAIGVIYRPDTERWSHYFHACLPKQFDTILHFDTTRALQPLERAVGWPNDETPETYPWAV